MRSDSKVQNLSIESLDFQVTAWNHRLTCGLYMCDSGSFYTGFNSAREAIAADLLAAIEVL
jgi:hypothetical protein